MILPGLVEIVQTGLRDESHVEIKSGDLKEGDPVVVAGSLYLVGAVRGMITGTTEES